MTTDDEAVRRPARRDGCPDWCCSDHTGLDRFVVEHTTGPLARYLPTASDHRWTLAVSQLEERRSAAAHRPVTVAVTLEDVTERTAPVELVLLPADARLLADLLLDGADRADGAVRAVG